MSRYRNTTAQPLVFDTAGHQIDAFGIAEVDAHDERSARHIEARRLVLVPGPVKFLEPSPAEESTQTDTEQEAETDSVEDSETVAPASTQTQTLTTKRTRSKTKESEQ